MTKFNITKCHGSGNDFILIDERRLPTLLTQLQRTALAVQLCDRNSILGADRFLSVYNSAQGDGTTRHVDAHALLAALAFDSEHG